MSAINTPPGATNSIAADTGVVSPNFAPPTDTSDLLSQQIPGGGTTTTNPPRVIASKNLGLNLGFIEQVTPKPRSQKITDSIAQDIIELYGPTPSAGHDKIEKLPGGIVGIFHIPTSTFTRPLEVSALHIPVDAKSHGLSKTPILQHPTSRKLIAGLGSVQSADTPHS